MKLMLRRTLVLYTIIELSTANTPNCKIRVEQYAVFFIYVSTFLHNTLWLKPIILYLLLTQGLSLGLKQPV